MKRKKTLHEALEELDQAFSNLGKELAKELRLRELLDWMERKLEKEN